MPAIENPPTHQVTVMSDRRKHLPNRPSEGGKTIDSNSGRGVWDGPVGTIRLSLMKTGVFQFPASGANGSRQSSDEPSKKRRKDANDATAKSD